MHNQPNNFALRSPKNIHLLPGEHGKIWWRLEVGWGKVACWSTKALISLKRVNVQESYYGGPIGYHLRSFERYHPRLPKASSSPRLGFATQSRSKLQSLLPHSQETAKYELQIWPEHSQGPSEQKPIKIWRKGSVGVSRDCPFLGVPLLSLEQVKLYELQIFTPRATFLT